MRILSGIYKGRIISPPKNLPIRPTTDRTKESLINILVHNYGLEGKEVLDLFAGSGTMGIEFLSNGASHLCSVEMNRRCTNWLRDLKLELEIDSWDIQQNEVTAYLKNDPESFDLIFADPPYNWPGVASLPDLIMKNAKLKSQGILIIEHDKKLMFEHEQYQDRREYGRTCFSFFSAPD